MRKIDSFFVLILVLISGLAVLYKSAQYDLSGLQFQKMVNLELQRQIKVLTLKNRELEIKYNELRSQKGLSTSVDTRGLASVAQNQDSAQEEVWVDPDIQAQNILKSIQSTCHGRKNSKCIGHVDAMVTQFPGSTWAGQSLVFLAAHYQENKLQAEANEILFILDSDFKKDKVVHELKKKYFEVQ